MGVIDVTVLVCEAITGIAPDEFDVVLQVAAFDACVGGGHGVAVVNGVNPLVTRDGYLYGVFSGRQTSYEVHRGGAFALARISTRKADLS